MFDCYCKIEGIPGESTSAGHEDWIEVLSVRHGLTQPSSASRSSVGGGTAERADHGDIYITKQMDKSSPKLALFCHQGKHINEVLLDFCRASEPKVLYMQIKMEKVIISKVEMTGSASAEGGFPTEEVGFNYGKITWTYTQQKRADGSGGGKVTSFVDLTTQTSG